MTLDMDAADPREHLADALAARLSRAILDDGDGSVVTERRLWRVPELTAEYVFAGAPADQGKHIDSLVHRLRLKTVNVISTQLDRSGVVRALAMRVAMAKSQFAFRSWRLEDVPRFITLLDDATLWEKLPERYPGRITRDMAEGLIRLANGFPEHHTVSAVECRNDLIGQVRLQFDSSPYPDSAEISYWIGQPYWGKGLATHFITLFTSDSFTARPGLMRIFARVHEGNAASVRVLEKAGYRRESNLFSRQPHGSRTLTFGVYRADYAAVSAEPRVVMARAEPPAPRPARKRPATSFGHAGWLVFSGEVAGVLQACAAV